MHAHRLDKTLDKSTRNWTLNRLQE